MLTKLRPKNEFNRNVLTLLTGTTIAQAIPIAISPILTRIYTPDDFGVFAIFIALSAVFGSIATGRYELAIILPEKDSDAINLLALGLIITFFLSLILFVLVLFFNEYLVGILANKEIGVWLYLVPVSVFLLGLFNLLTYFNTRKKMYKDIAKATVIKGVTLAVVQLMVGFVKSGALGLICGQLFAQLFSNMKLIKNTIKNKILINKIKLQNIQYCARRYSMFPKFSMPAVFLNSLSLHISNLLIPAFFSISTLGIYSLVQRVLGLPSALIGASIGQVFLQQGTEEKQETGAARDAFNSTLRKLLLIGATCFGVLFFVVEDLFAFVFGEAWRQAGEYAQIVIPLFFIRFVSSSLSATLIIFEKQKVELIINVLLLGSILGPILMCNDFKTFLYFFSTLTSLSYLIYLVYYYYLAKGNRSHA